MEKLGFSELKIEKVKFFSQNPTQILCISVFNFGGCLSNFLTFRPLTTWLLIKKTCKPTRVTGTNATTFDYILTNAFLYKQIEMGIIKTEISDHFAIFLITDPITSSEIKSKRTLLYKIRVNATTKENFKNILARKTRDYIKEIVNPNAKPVANFCMICPHFMRKLFQNKKSRLNKKTSLVPGLLKE